MTLDARVAERGVLIPPESEYGLIHLLGVEHLKPPEEVKIFYRQTSDSLEQVWLDLSDYVLQRVLPEIGQMVKYMNAGIRVANLMSFSCTSFAWT